MREKIKVCVVVLSRANYGRIKTVLEAAKKSNTIELQIVVGASMTLERYGMGLEVMKKEGFFPDQIIYNAVDGERPIVQCKTTGLGIIELSSAFENLLPDYVVTVADRYETMSTAIAATYCNIPLIHVQGGEVSGNIDDRVRNAVTKLADIHFPSTEAKKKRIISMEVSADTVFNFGCPSIDVALRTDKIISNKTMKRYSGVGKEIDWQKPYLLVVQHPVTTSFGKGYQQITETLNAINEFKDHQKIILWPNIDSGSDHITKGIRAFFEENENSTGKYHCYKNFSPEDYTRVLYNTDCAIGNSSSFIREGAALGTPAVLVGDRQVGREHGANVVYTQYSSKEISTAVSKQIKKGRYNPSNLFGAGNAGEKIVERIEQLETHIKS